MVFQDVKYALISISAPWILGLLAWLPGYVVGQSTVSWVPLAVFLGFVIRVVYGYRFVKIKAGHGGWAVLSLFGFVGWLVLAFVFANRA